MIAKLDWWWMQLLAWLGHWVWRQHQRAHARFQVRWLKEELRQQGVWRN
jgi:hypothetical protein